MAENKTQGTTAASDNALSLSDVLNEAPADACNITSNLHFRYDSASGNTVLDVKLPDGSTSGVQPIVLPGVDLTSGGSLSDSQVIQMLLAQGRFVTEI